MHKRLIEFLNDQKVLHKKTIWISKKTTHTISTPIENIENAINDYLCVEYLLTYKKHLIP